MTNVSTIQQTAGRVIVAILAGALPHEVQTPIRVIIAHLHAQRLPRQHQEPLTPLLAAHEKVIHTIESCGRHQFPACKQLIQHFRAQYEHSAGGRIDIHVGELETALLLRQCELLTQHYPEQEQDINP